MSPHEAGKLLRVVLINNEQKKETSKNEPL